MQGYEETEIAQNLNAVPLLGFFLKINAKSFYVFYLIHDLIWSMIFVVFGILLRIEIFSLGSYNSLFGRNYAAFIYTLIGFGGVFLCFVVIFAAYVNEVSYHKAKKVYIIWRFIICVLHLLVCLFLVIFFAIFNNSLKSVFEENQISPDVSYDIVNYFDIGIGVSCFLVLYSCLNTYNSYILIKACKNIQGDLINENSMKGLEGWTGVSNKVVPVS